LKFALLAWGSLVWNPGELKITGDWKKDGPCLPIEFTELLFMTYDPAAGCRPVSIEKFKGNHQPDILVIKQLSGNSSKQTANL